MVLKDTVEMMNSDDYKERFKAEYYQLVIRYNKLKSMLVKWDKGTLNLIQFVQEVYIICRLRLWLIILQF